MRISTANAFDRGIDVLATRSVELGEAQARMASGKRIAKASDDPAGAARAEHALDLILRSDTNQRAVDSSQIAVSQTESAFGSATSMLQQARELLVAAGDAGYSDEQRQTLSTQLKQIRDQLLDIANRSDGAGSYLFAGQGATQRPFIDAPGGVQFVASAGQMQTEASTGLPLTSDGSSVWLGARTGNGVFLTAAAAGVRTASIDNGQVYDPALLTGSDYTLQFSVAGGVTTYAVLRDGLPTAVTSAPYVSGQRIEVDGMAVSVSGAPRAGDSFTIVPSTSTLSVFDAMDKAVADLATPRRTGWEVAQSNADNLRNIDSVLTTLQAGRALAGAVLNRIDAETDRLSGMKVTAQTVRSNAEDIDMVAAISTFQNRQSGYDAALKSYSMVQRLTLFQYLGG